MKIVVSLLWGFGAWLLYVGISVSLTLIALLVGASQGVIMALALVGVISGIPVAAYYAAWIFRRLD